MISIHAVGIPTCAYDFDKCVFPNSTPLVPKTTNSIVLDGDYEQIVGSDKQKFLRECTSALSSNGRDVECVDVRSGSIIVDVRGSKAALDAAVADVGTKGLNLPSFKKLSVQGVAEWCCTFRFCCFRCICMFVAISVDLSR